jgi:hypothetical protein
MNDTFRFYGQTAFINRPIDTVVRDFQNTYVTGAAGKDAEVLRQLERLLELMLGSSDLTDDTKEDAARAVHSLALEVTRKERSKLSLMGTLTAIADVVGKAADIATPAAALVAAVMRLLGLA